MMTSAKNDSIPLIQRCAMLLERSVGPRVGSRPMRSHQAIGRDDRISER
jgi:hypothetical protein